MSSVIDLRAYLNPSVIQTLVLVDLQQEYVARRAGAFARWIEGFEPHRVDMIFERNRPSCHASADFTEVRRAGGGSFVLAGLPARRPALRPRSMPIIAVTL